MKASEGHARWRGQRTDLIRETKQAGEGAHLLERAEGLVQMRKGDGTNLLEKSELPTDQWHLMRGRRHCRFGVFRGGVDDEVDRVVIKDEGVRAVLVDFWRESSPVTHSSLRLTRAVSSRVAAIPSRSPASPLDPAQCRRALVTGIMYGPVITRFAHGNVDSARLMSLSLLGPKVSARKIWDTMGTFSTHSACYWVPYQTHARSCASWIQSKQ